MIRECRYEVFKIKDINKYLTSTEIYQLVQISKKIEVGRANDNKKPLICAVIESDWAEYEPVWKMVEDRVDKTNEENK